MDAMLDFTIAHWQIATVLILIAVMLGLAHMPQREWIRETRKLCRRPECNLSYEDDELAPIFPCAMCGMTEAEYFGDAER